MRSSFSILLILSSAGLSLARCYNRDGSIATDLQTCPGKTHCCRLTDTCTTNGLCIDINNHLPDTSLSTVPDGSVINGTNLYQTTTCTNADFSGCVTQCTTPSTVGNAYLWACNTGLTNFCCAAPSPLATNQACCNTAGSLFRLQQAIALPWNSTVSPVTATSPQTPSTSAGRASSTLSTNVSNASVTSSAANTVAAAIANGNSQGTQIGVGVGVAVGVLILIVLGVFLWRRRAQGKRKAMQSSHGEVHERRSGLQATSEYQYHAVSTSADEKPAATVDQRPAPVEADSTARVYELPGHQAGEMP